MVRGRTAISGDVIRAAFNIFASAVNVKHIPYKPLTENSNAYVYSAIRKVLKQNPTPGPWETGADVDVLP